MKSNVKSNRFVNPFVMVFRAALIHSGLLSSAFPDFFVPPSLPVWGRRRRRRSVYQLAVAAAWHAEI